MGVDLLASAALTSAAAALAKQLYPLLLDKLKTRDKPFIEISLKGQRFKVQTDKAAELLSRLKQEMTAAEDVPGGTLDLSRVAKQVSAPDEVSTSAPESEDYSSQKSVAFGIDPSAVLADARRHIDLVFKVNLAVAIALAVILVGGIAGSVISAAILREGTWAMVFGGVSLADLLGVYVFKPLDAVNAAVVATQRLDTIHLRLREQLRACLQYTNITDRIACQTDVWNAIQSELASLAGKNA